SWIGSKPDGAGKDDIRVPISFAKRNWEIIYSGRGPTVSKSPLPWVAYLSGGAFVSLLFAAAFFAVTRSSERLQAEKTARDRVLRELAMSEARATTVLRHAPVAILIAEAPTGRIVYGNDSVEKICGYDFSDFRCVQDYGKQQAVHPDGRPYRASEWPLARAITQGEIVEAEEIGITRSDGSRAFISVNAAPIRDEQGNIISAVVAFVDITERRRRDLEKTEEEEKRQLVMRELTHRIKNLFAVVQAMVRQIARNSDSVRAFEDGFTGRLQALSFAHDLLVGQNWQGAPIEDVIRAQLRAFLDGAFSRVSLQGPPLWVNPAAAQHLGLAMFELATNAAKYGALSTQEGTVSVEWTDPADGFRLTWRESGGPPVCPPTRKGFGSVVLERMMAGWGATSVIDYAPAGLVWALRADSRSAMDSFLTPERPPVGSAPQQDSRTRDGEPSSS
ncbi:sensor histidine kinase, partial [Rhodoplanes sp. SY1]|uniref:sensor histidine kinase n=1 Tax=Rhodoplanes sp. SY1 TaxID=3166646 RepID=UPI0038B52115